MRPILLFLALCFAALARSEQVILIPADDRPACTQFVQMVGAMDDIDVIIPPAEIIGKFTTPGDPDKILDWVAKQDLDKCVGVILSADMLCYGGLVASRVHKTTLEQAQKRLDRLFQIKRAHPKTKFLAFSAIMRLNATATAENASWRDALRHFIVQPNAESRSKVPAGVIEDYFAARKRDVQIQKKLIDLAARSTLRFLALGQDDTTVNGPHLNEVQELKQYASAKSANARVKYIQGVDQVALVLLSRLLLERDAYKPRVQVVYADPAARSKVAIYEAVPLARSLADQLETSGSVVVPADETCDYVLYINTPGSTNQQAANLVQKIRQQVGTGLYAALADANLGDNGRADERLFRGLSENREAGGLLSYAAWNTAANTFGTTVPAANIALLAEQNKVDPLKRVPARLKFLVHRLANDFGFNTMTRSQGYALLGANPTTSRDETYGPELKEVEKFVQQDLARRVRQIEFDFVKGQKFNVGEKWYMFGTVENIGIELPWPRLFETKLDFDLQFGRTAP